MTAAACSCYMLSVNHQCTCQRRCCMNVVYVHRCCQLQHLVGAFRNHMQDTTLAPMSCLSMCVACKFSVHSCCDKLFNDDASGVSDKPPRAAKDTECCSLQTCIRNQTLRVYAIIRYTCNYDVLIHSLVFAGHPPRARHKPFHAERLLLSQQTFDTNAMNCTFDGFCDVEKCSKAMHSLQRGSVSHSSHMPKREHRT